VTGSRIFVMNREHNIRTPSRWLDHVSDHI
jgi:hypothetical protein